MNEAMEITCQELVELVTAYLEGALPPPDRARFETHLGDCEHCKAYVEQMRLTIRLLGHLEEASLPLTVWERLLAAFRDWKRST